MTIFRPFLMVLFGVLLTAASALLPGLGGSGPAYALDRCTISDLAFDSVEADVLSLINAHRAANGGLAALSMSPSLNRAASWLANDMAEKNYLSHTDSFGRDPFQRMANCDVAGGTFQAENVAAGYATAQDVFDGWKNSQGHNANMLNGVYRSIGIARVYSSTATYGWYWSSNFSSEVVASTPAPAPAPTTPPTTAPTPPAAPTMSISLAGGGTVRVEFTTAAGTVVDVETACAYCPWVPLTSTTASPYFHTGLAAGSSQCYRLIARDPATSLQSGYSSWACLAIN